MSSVALGLAALLASTVLVLSDTDKKDVDLKASDGLSLRGTCSTASERQEL